MERLIPALQGLHGTIQGGIAHQIALMKQHNAGASSLRDVEKLLATSSADVARALLEIQKRSIDIMNDISR